jgi:hypothetical protein
MSQTPPNSQKVAVTWIDLLSVLLIAVMGMGLWHLCESQVRDTLGGAKPGEVVIQERFRIPHLQRELIRAEETWKAASKELAAQRLEQIRQAATLAALARTTEEYHKALAESAISSGRVKRLVPYVQALEIYVGRREAALSRARRDAAGEWEEVQAEHERRRKLATLGWAAGLAAVLLIALWASLAWSGSFQPPGSAHPGRVLATAAVLLAALFGYQAVGAPGLALASAALLLGLLVALLHRPTS